MIKPGEDYASSRKGVERNIACLGRTEYDNYLLYRSVSLKNSK